MSACAVPPAGWRCTRAPGHNGPCAAVPDHKDGIAPAGLGGVGRALLRFVRWLMALGVVLGLAGVVRPDVMAHPSRAAAAMLLAVSLFNLWQFKDLR